MNHQRQFLVLLAFSLSAALWLLSCSTDSRTTRQESRPEPSSVPEERAAPGQTRLVSLPDSPPHWQVPSEPREFPFLQDENPHASVSLGTTSDGVLVNGHHMPVAAHYMQLPVHWSRGLAYGSRQLIDTLVAGANAVSERFPGTVLYMGNIGRHNGGDIPWSVSHNNGRDADLAYFSVDPFGWQSRPSGLLHFQESLHSAEHFGFYRFDAPRNAVLIRELHTHESSQSQYMFMARHLQRPVYDWLEADGTDLGVIGQLKEVLHEPRTALPHDDHLHLRVYCSSRDVCGGCINNGRMRAWVDGYESERRACIEDYSKRVQRSDQPKERAAAVLRLGLLDARGEFEAVLAALSDDDEAVRAAAARVLGDFGSERATEALIAGDRKETSPAVRCATAVALGQIGTNESAAHLGSLLSAPGICDTDDGPTPLAAIAAGALEETETTAAVEALITALEHDDVRVRVASAEALRKLTNRSEAVDWGSAPPHGDIATAGREAWSSWFEDHGDESRARWLVAGFTAAGYDVTALDASQVPGLLDAILGAPHHAFNAQRALMRIADDYPPSLDWSIADAAWYWTRHFKQRESEFGLDLSDRPERPIVAQ